MPDYLRAATSLVMRPSLTATSLMPCDWLPPPSHVATKRICPQLWIFVGFIVNE